jgi:hypothetical protein
VVVVLVVLVDHLTLERMEATLCLTRSLRPVAVAVVVLTMLLCIAVVTVVQVVAVVITLVVLAQLLVQVTHPQLHHHKEATAEHQRVAQALAVAVVLVR